MFLRTLTSQHLPFWFGGTAKRNEKVVLNHGYYRHTNSKTLDGK